MSAVLKARIAGVLYLFGGSAGAFAELFVRDGVVVRGDAAATAANILAHEWLYRLGGSLDLLGLACDAALALIFVSRDLAGPVQLDDHIGHLGARRLASAGAGGCPQLRDVA